MYMNFYIHICIYVVTKNKKKINSKLCKLIENNFKRATFPEKISP